MTKNEMLKIVDEQVKAYNQRNLMKFCACYHDEIKIERLFNPTKSINGIKKFQKKYEDLFNNSPLLKCEIKSRTALDHAIIDEEKISGSANFSDELHTIAIYGFRDGLIDRVWFTY
jgi:hypothetical protein